MKAAYLTALGLVGNREDALELSQEAFFRAYQHYDQLQAQGKFFAWFYQILRNLCFSHLRRRRVRRAYETSNAEDGGQWTQDGDPDGHSADAGGPFDPEVVAERNESKDRLWRAIGQLDEKHREVIILRHFQNLSYDEMAKLLFCNRGTVTSRLFYARQRLKEILEEAPGPAAPGGGIPQDSGASDDARIEGMGLRNAKQSAGDSVPPSDRGHEPAPAQAGGARDTAIQEPRKGGQTL